MRNQPRNREIKTNPDPWESTTEQRNQNNPYPWEINPKNREIISNPYPWETNPKNTEKSKPTQTHEKSNQRTHRKIKTQNTNHDPKLQKSNSTNKSTSPRFMRRKEVEH